MPLPPRTDPQAEYFDAINNRFDQNLLLNPLPAQQWEMQHLTQVLALSPPATIIDFGTGSGRVALHLVQQGFDVTGVDVSTGSLMDLDRFYRRHRQPGWGKLRLATAMPNTKADAIVGADILHHIPMATYFPRFKNHLKPGGKIAFLEPNAWHLPWYLFYWLNRIPWEIEKGILHCSIPYLTSQLRQAKFDTVAIHGHGLVPTPFFNQSPRWSHQNSLAWGNYRFTKPLAFRFIVTAQVNRD